MKLTVKHVDGMRFLAAAEGHTVAVDAAPEDGGSGTALTAPQLFAAAIGACVLEFVANSCRLRDIPFDRLSLDVKYEEAPRPRRIAGLGMTLHIEPEPAEDAKRRLIGVARRATLVNTLARSPEMAIRFAGQSE